jgi:hypothetical protein
VGICPQRTWRATAHAAQPTRVTAWTRTASALTTDLSEDRVDWLHQELLRYRDLLDIARDNGALCPRLRTVLGADGGSPGRSVLDRVRFSINIVIVSLPLGGGQIVVRDQRTRWSWIMVLRDLGLLVAQHLGLAGLQDVNWLWQQVHCLEGVTGQPG